MKRFYIYAIFMLIFSSGFNGAFAENIEFPDPNLANKVREALNLPAGADIPKAELATLTDLDASAPQGAAPEAKIDTLTGLEHAVQLRELTLESNEIRDVTPLQGLTRLMDLSLEANEISDVTPLAGLTQLNFLSLASNKISDVTPLAGLTQLNFLSLRSNEIRDITPLAGLTQLIQLFLDANEIRDIAALQGLTQLTELSLASNKISDVTPLAGLTQLTELLLDTNEISDVTPLAGLTKLTRLKLTENPAKDTSPLDPILRQNPAIYLYMDTDTIWSVSFSPDGALLASGASDGMIQLWNVATQETIATLEGGTDGVTSVEFSPAGGLLASGGSEGTVKLWEVATQENIATLEGHKLPVWSVSFSPDGTLIASGAAGSKSLDDSRDPEETVKLWDVTTQENIATFELHTAGVASVSFSPDGTLLAAGGGGFLSGILKLWEVATQENTAILEGEFETDIARVASVSFSPDGTLIAAGTDHGTVELWDVATQENIATLKGHINDIQSVSFSPDGTLLASGGSDGRVKFWDVAESTYKLVQVSGNAQQGMFGSVVAEPLVVEARDQHNTPLPGIEVTFTVTAGEGKLSGQFAVEKVMTDANGRASLPFTLGHTPLNTVVVSIAGGYKLVTFDAVGVSSDQIASFEGSSASFSPDGTLLATGGFEGIQLWEVATQETIATLPTELPTDPLELFTNIIFSVSFSPDGTLLASGAIDGTVKVWDVERKETIAILEGHTDTVFSVSFSSDGTLLASGSVDGTVKVWDVEKKENITTLEGPADGIFSVSFSPSGALLAFGAPDGTVKVWDAATQETVATLPTAAVISVSFSPAGALLASGNANGTVKVWNVATQKTVATLEGAFVLFSPDGRHLAMTVEDGIKVWDVERKESIATLSTAAVIPLSFSPAGALLASGDTETVKLWNIAPYITRREPEKLAGDVNGDGTVNIQDLVLVAAHLGKTGQTDADVNADGVVDIRDLVKVAGALGAAAAPSLHPHTFAMFTATDVQQWLSQAQHLNVTDATSQRGIRFLEHLLAALIPKETALFANYPNPFNPETWIPYQLSKPAEVRVTIYDIHGRVARALDLGHQPAGIYQNRSRAAYWDGKNELGEPVASGIYFYQLTTPAFQQTRRLVIVK